MEAMLPPNEDFLQQLWLQMNHLAPCLSLTSGQSLQIINPGIRNPHDGPDFINAVIKIDQITWCGCVELHLKSSMWVQHGHHKDPLYNNVILHVVAQHDAEAYSHDEQQLPCVVLPHTQALWAHLHQLFEQATLPRCGSTLVSINPLTRTAWFDRMMAQRYQTKADVILSQVNRLSMGWEEAFYRSLTRSLGLKANAHPMALLAQHIPYTVIMKARHNIQTLEAILQGQAGFLHNLASLYPHDTYIHTLTTEYAYQRMKFQLKPIPQGQWKLRGIRPPAFPFVRIAQLCTLLHTQPALFNLLMETKTLKEVSAILTVETTPYWEQHYQFGKCAKRSTKKRIGEQMVRTITINTIIPFKFAWALYTGTDTIRQQAYTMLTELPAEDNTITRAFAQQGITCNNAYDSQALIELAKEYCQKRNCYHCPGGITIMRKLLASPLLV